MESLCCLKVSLRVGCVGLTADHGHPLRPAVHAGPGLGCADQTQLCLFRLLPSAVLSVAFLERAVECSVTDVRLRRADLLPPARRPRPGWQRQSRGRQVWRLQLRHTHHGDAAADGHAEDAGPPHARADGR